MNNMETCDSSALETEKKITKNIRRWYFLRRKAINITKQKEDPKMYVCSSLNLKDLKYIWTET